MNTRTRRSTEIDEILKTIRALLKKKDASAAVKSWIKEARTRSTSTSTSTLTKAVHAAKAINSATSDDIDGARATGSGLSMPGATEPAPGRPKKSGDFSKLSPHQQEKIRRIAEAQAQEADLDTAIGYGLSLADNSVYAIEDDRGKIAFVWFDPMTGDPIDGAHLVQREMRNPTIRSKSILGIPVRKVIRYE